MPSPLPPAPSIDSPRRVTTMPAPLMTMVGRLPPGPRTLAKMPLQSIVIDLVILKVALVLESNTSRQLMNPPPALTALWAAWKDRQGNVRVQLLLSSPAPDTKACRMA